MKYFTTGTSISLPTLNIQSIQLFPDDYLENATCREEKFLFEVADSAKWIYGITRDVYAGGNETWADRTDHFDSVDVLSEEYYEPKSVPSMFCVVCHGTDVLSQYPKRVSFVSDPCWNPSTSDNNFEFCKAPFAKCFTETFQYSSKADYNEDVLSYTVGVRRGCVQG